MNNLLQVFTENYKLLFRIAYAIIGDIEDTKDILQETFIRAYKSSQLPTRSNELLSWIIVIAKNRAKTCLEQKVAVVPTDFIIEQISFEPDYLEFVVYDIVNELISIVPEDLREPLKIHFVNDIPLKKLVNDCNITYYRLRYWKKEFLESIKPFIKQLYF